MRLDTFAELVATIEAALRGPLPGEAAHQLMAPRPRREWPEGLDSSRIRHAAGLLLVSFRDDRAYVVLTVRADTLDRHSGQVSMPGGVVEPGESFEQAALREAEEEIGLSRDSSRVLGQLTPIDIPVSGFRLHPVVAAADAWPALHAADGEVARILEAAIDQLMDPARILWRSATQGSRSFEFPAFSEGDVEIWGATAMVLAEFLTLLGWHGPAAT